MTRCDDREPDVRRWGDAVHLRKRSLLAAIGGWTSDGAPEFTLLAALSSGKSLDRSGGAAILGSMSLGLWSGKRQMGNVSRGERFLLWRTRPG